MAEDAVKRSSVTIATAIIAACAPIAVGVHGMFEAWRTRQQAQQALIQQVRTEYFNRLENSLADAQGRERLLTFILATSDDARLKDWATQELQRTRVDRGHVEASIGQKEKELDQARRELAEETAREGPARPNVALNLEIKRDRVERLSNEVRQLQYGTSQTATRRSIPVQQTVNQAAQQAP
jgi:hypothetical protein